MSPERRGPRAVIDLPDLGQRLPRLSPGGLRIALVVAIVAVVAIGSVYTIEPEEAGVVQRFGKYVRTSVPGLHLKLPLGIERVTKVPVERQLKQEFGFRTERAGVRSEVSTRGREDESNMLTGDLNAAVVEWVVQYRIGDPQAFLFRVRNVEDTLRDMSEAIMREVVGDRTVDEVLTVGRQEVADLVERRLQLLCEQYETGIEIDQVVLQNVNPPDPVKPSFNEVNQAEQERETKINQAQSEYNRVIFRAAGEAEQTVRAAEGYALDRVNRAQGEAARFSSVYGEYRKAPEITRKRLYLEMLETVLPKMGRKLVIDGDLEGVLPLLRLDDVRGEAEP